MSLPTTTRAVQVREKTTDVDKALTINTIPLAAPAAGQVVVKVQYAGANATDLNSFLGGYGGGEVPFTVGLEGLGTVVAVGAEVKSVKPGQAVLTGGLGAFVEYQTVPEAVLIPVPAVDPKLLTIPVSALTAKVAIEELAEAKAGEVALVTAAAGGTGQFAVQYLKQKGLTVIGTCSTEDKVAFLKSLGVDRVINYKTEDLGAVLKAEYPKGVDVVYESIGGAVFETALENLAVFGRVIIIGAITGYKTQTSFQRAADATPLPLIAVQKGASLKGFFLTLYAAKLPVYGPGTIEEIVTGKVVAHIDSVPFKGIEAVPEAIKHLHSGKSFGKVVVQIAE